MYLEVLPEGGRKWTGKLGTVAAEWEFRLAGGTAVALQLGHRRSEDLDFFSTRPFDPEDLSRVLSGTGPFSAESASRGTLHGTFGRIRTSWLYYPYPWLEEPALRKPCPVAHLADIAAMKISAIASRGSRRDFVDLYAIVTRSLPLGAALASFEKKFAGRSYSRYHILKSLAYFEDAEKDPPVRPLATGPDWEEVKRFFADQVRRLWGA